MRVPVRTFGWLRLVEEMMAAAHSVYRPKKSEEKKREVKIRREEERERERKNGFEILVFYYRLAITPHSATVRASTPLYRQL